MEQSKAAPFFISARFCMSTDQAVLSIFCFFSMVASVLALSAIVVSSRISRRDRRSGDEE